MSPRFSFGLVIALLLTCTVAAKAEQGVIAVVNDHPVTNFDVDQRIKLLQLLGERNPARLARKAAANDLINDFIKIDEAKLDHFEPAAKDIDDRLKSMAQNMKTDDVGFKSKVAAAGLTVEGLRQYFTAQISFARILQGKFHEKIAVDQAEVDRKYAAVKADIQGKVAKIESDPRRQPVRVLSLQEINFPVEGNDAQLLQSRAIEANQVAQKVSSCSAVKGAAAGIFNVQVGRKIEADSRKLPPPMLAQLQQRGQGHAIGPMRYAKGIQLLVFCGSRMIVPPKLNVQLPTRQQIENLALNDKYISVEQKYMAILRKSAIIEYKDQAYAQ